MALTPHLDQRKVDYRETLGDSASTVLSIWIYFNLVSDLILLPIFVLTILASKKIKRHPTFINLCLTWIFSGIFSLLLFFTHQYNKDSEPPAGLCVAQASLLYGIIPMWAVAVLVLFYYIYKSLHGEAEFRPAVLWLMLCAPYVFQIVFSATALVVSSLHPGLVSRGHSFFYCHLHCKALAISRTVFVSLCSICVLVIEVLLLRKIYRNYSSTRHVAITGQNQSLRSIARVLIFGVYLIFGAAVGLVEVIDTKSVLPQMYVATAGTVVFLVFGTQTDILRVWFPFLFRHKPNRVLSRPRRRSTLPTSDSEPCSDYTVNSSASALRPPSENMSFNLDELFPPSPAVVRESPAASLYYIRYAV